MSAPVTEFEASGGLSWTSLAGEAAFLDAVSALGPRVRVVSAGINAAGRALRWVVIAHPGASSVGDRPAVLFVAQQHGAEAAGREALLQLIRELATTADPELVDYLSRVTVVCIPTANPDGLPGVVAPNGTYENAQGVNLNRDHYELTQAESRSIQRAITQYQPVIVVDSHEAGGGIARNFGFQRGTDATIHPAIRALNDVLCSDLIARGDLIGYDGYLFSDSVERSASLRQAAGVRNGMSLLFETDMAPTLDGVAAPRALRAEFQSASFRYVIDFHKRNFDAISAACGAARVLGAVRRAYPDTVFDWGGGSESRTTPPGYFVTTAQRTTHDAIFDSFGLPESASTGGVDVSIEGHFPLALVLMDSRSSNKAFSAAPLSSEPLQPGYGPQQQTQAGFRRADRFVDTGAGWRRADVRVLVGGAWQ